MVRDPIRRIGKYSAKMDPTIISKRYENLKEIMVEQFTPKATDLMTIEQSVKILLDDEGVQIIKIPFYLSFAREIYKIVRTHTGNQALEEIKLCINKWKSAERGLDEDVLKKIVSNVFGITIPTSP